MYKRRVRKHCCASAPDSKFPILRFDTSCSEIQLYFASTQKRKINYIFDGVGLNENSSIFLPWKLMITNQYLVWLAEFILQKWWKKTLQNSSIPLCFAFFSSALLRIFRLIEMDFCISTISWCGGEVNERKNGKISIKLNMYRLNFDGKCIWKIKLFRQKLPSLLCVCVPVRISI